jgi:hypothetical protein
VKDAGADWDSENYSEVSVKLECGLITARGPNSSSKGAEKSLEVLK